jgi:hypothetical protein
MPRDWLGSLDRASHLARLVQSDRGQGVLRSMEEHVRASVMLCMYWQLWGWT